MSRSGRAERSADGAGAPDGGPALVLGTAGHIDHGKSSLVRALTGVDPDRLPEEKARGITIELGFAPLELGGGLSLGVVDVPGHEGLVRTMVAGASGIDLVLLVVAADEGVMPQTREHLAICRLLGLRRGVVALTKADLVDDDVLALARDEISALLATTALAGAECVPVSARTGAGLDALRDALRRAARAAEPRTPRRGPPRLWVDRAFEMRGFGPVVTGTLTGAPLRAGEAVELAPPPRRARVRGLQRFGAALAEAPPGARCAVNLHGVELAGLARGMRLTRPGAIAATALFDAALEWLPDVPALEGEPASFELLVGTGRARARVAPIAAPAAAGPASSAAPRIGPGERGFARVHVDGPALPLLPGDRFVLRAFARVGEAGSTVGGGTVLDVAPPHRRRSDPALAAELAALASGDDAVGLRVRVARAGYAGVARARLARELGLEEAELAAPLAACGDALVALGDRVASAAALAALVEQAAGALGEFHRREPLRPGMPRAALRGALPENAAPALVERALAELVAAGRAAPEGESLRAADFRPRLSARQREAAERLREGARAAGLEPRTFREWRDELALPEAELRDVLATLERDGSLVRAPGDLFFDRQAVDALRERLVAWLEQHGEIGTAAYKELIGTSRKYAVPLMELFDSEHLTVRRGEARLLRRTPSAAT